MSRSIVDFFGGPIRATFRLIVGGSVASANYLTTTNEPGSSARNQIMRESPIKFYSHMLAKSVFFGSMPAVTLGVIMVSPNYVHTMWFSPVNEPDIPTTLNTKLQSHTITDYPSKDYKHPFIWAAFKSMF